MFVLFPGTPINRLPIMAKQVLDLYELYNLVCARGGLVEVINKKQWQVNDNYFTNSSKRS